jgi:hypothetical protein
VADSPQVRRLLSEAANLEAEKHRSRQALPDPQQVQLTIDMRAHPKRYMAERSKLIETMAQQAGILVTGEQYFRILEESPAGCADDPVTTSNYLRVRVSTGPSKGSEGWACSRDVQPRGQWVM